MDRDWTASFSIRFRNGTCIIILDKKYNIANRSCHFGSYGSIWTGPSPKKYYMDLIWQYMDRSVTKKILYGPHMAVYGPVRHQKNIIWTSYGSIWTGPSPKKFFGDGPVHILFAMNYLLYITIS